MGCLKLSEYKPTEFTVKRGGKHLTSDKSISRGYNYYDARYYEPKTEQWLSVDPIALYDPINEVEHYIDGQPNGGYFNLKNSPTLASGVA